MGRLLLSVLVVSAFVAVDGAEAQESRPERPYRGLFASGLDDAEQLLKATASVGGGWDDNLAADAIGRNTPVSDVNRQFKGGLGTVSAGLTYSLSLERIGFGASAASTGRYYPSQDRQFLRRDYGSVGTSDVLGAGFSAQASAVYQPFSLHSMTPFLFEPQVDDPAAVDQDFPSSLEHYFGYSGGVSFVRQLSRRTTFSSMYSYGGREPLGEIGRFDRHSAAGSLSRTIGRGLALQLGYRYSQAQYGSDGRHENHIIDAGVNYDRALSFSRRTTLSFSTGTSASRVEPSGSLRYRLTGAARLSHEIGRTWVASLSYDRGLRFTESWLEPLFTDSASAGLNGFFNRRVQAHLVGRWVRGVGQQDGGEGIENYSASAGLSFAISRYVNSGVNYSYYVHEFGSSVVLPPGYARDFERRSIRAYVSLWAPLFQRSRTR
jgi:hypothetical protein